MHEHTQWARPGHTTRNMIGEPLFPPLPGALLPAPLFAVPYASPFFERGITGRLPEQHLLDYLSRMLRTLLFVVPFVPHHPAERARPDPRRPTGAGCRTAGRPPRCGARRAAGTRRRAPCCRARRATAPRCARCPGRVPRAPGAGASTGCATR
ncbi:hypothetical protein [Streptomyces misionensis]|uniref:hypothetical protein n=1 Tax=Streptomyces misionensis TaxID=67331 RepID=UPI001647A967|nr:hypothetical protein [Streptomyces misionensis]